MIATRIISWSHRSMTRFVRIRKNGFAGAATKFHFFAPVTLRGPGIETERAFAPRGIGRGFWSTWTANNKRYPLGVDAYLFDATAVVGLPRTVQAQS